MIDLRYGDCLDLFQKTEPQSVDAIIADIPYGTTACKWDTVIPFEPMWAGIKRVIKPRGAVVLFGSQPFTSALVMSNPQWFRYEWVWNKSHSSGFQYAKYRPMQKHESICIFGDGGGTYNPQMTKGERKANRSGAVETERRRDSVMGKGLANLSRVWNDTYYPATSLYFDCGRRADSVHPTQKPVALMEYLVRTYTNEGDIVLDFTMGSGSTMVACVNTKRNGIGWELDADYFEIAQKRIAEAQKQTVMPL